MNEQETGTGWRPLAKPSRSSPRPTGESRNLNQRLNTDGSPILTPFVRLARTHVFHAAADATVAIALAGSLFFSIDPSAARSRVLLYLVLTLAPFSLVGPLIGPALDRMRGGRRLMIILTLVLRALLMLVMIPYIDSLWLFPIAFAQLVLGKTYAVAKAATVPTTVNSDDELVDKNSRLAVLSAVGGGLGAMPALALQPLFGSSVTLSYAFILYCFGLLAALKLPRVMVDDPNVPDDELEIRSAGVRLAASAMAMMRGVVGFMFFVLAFEFGGGDDVDLDGIGKAAGASVKAALGFDLGGASADPAWKIGMAGAAWGLGILVGNLLAPRLRTRVTEEKIILGALGVVAMAGFASLWAGGLSGAVLLAFVVGAAPSGAKLAFDSLVQRDAPGVNHGAAFGRFETRFQIAWVIGALLPVIIKMPLRVGFMVVAFAALFAGVTYFLGSRPALAANLKSRGESIRNRARKREAAPPLSGDGSSWDPDAPSSDAPSSDAPSPDAPAADAPSRSGRPPGAQPSNAGEPGDRLSPAPEPETVAAAQPASSADPYSQAFAERPVEPPPWDDSLGDDDDLPPWLNPGSNPKPAGQD